ncbi:hypothetical protein CHUAL_002176 [Chamberlinius hualienensis]
MGEMSPQLNVICPDYSKLLEEGIRRHLYEKNLTDVVFNCGGSVGSEIHAHRLMISIFIPELMAKLEENTSDLELNSDTLTSMIEFIYSGKVQVQTKDQLLKLKRDAEILQFELLVDSIEYLQTSLNIISEPKSVSSTVVFSQTIPVDNSIEAKLALVSVVDEGEISVETTRIALETVDETRLLPKKTRPVLTRDRLTYIRCTECDFETPSECLYLKHLYDQHNVNIQKDQLKITYRCYRCDFTSEDRDKWHAHRTVESRRGNFKCIECGKTFLYKFMLERHSRYNHSTDRPYRCDQCDYRGATKGLLIDHRKIHKNGNFKCPICDACFKLKSYLVRHTTKLHSSEEEKTFVCEICPKKYVRLCDLNKHVREAHRVVPVRNLSEKNSISIVTVPEKCHHCGFHTKHNKRLWIYHLAAKHQEDVDGNRLEPNIKCDQCDKTFCIEWQLSSHKMARHNEQKQLSNNEDKPFMCETCGHRTQFKNQLAAHRKIHSDEKFTCEFCGKIFSVKMNLQRHKRFMHNPNVKRHLCHICTFVTKRKAVLREHMNRVHSDTANETLESII